MVVLVLRLDQTSSTVERVTVRSIVLPGRSEQRVRRIFPYSDPGLRNSIAPLSHA